MKSCLRRVTSTFRPSLLRQFCAKDRGPTGTFDDILKKHRENNHETQLKPEDISVILRKKKVRDTMEVIKVPKGNAEPDMTIEQIRNMAKKNEEALAPKEEATLKTEEHMYDFMIYSSKLESYLKGVGPLPTGVTHFKYDLPIPNVDPEFRGVEEIADILRPLPKTPNENLWLSLPEITGDSSWEEFELAVKKKYNFEASMYGEEEDVAAYQDRMIERFGEDLIPLERLMDPKYMDRVRDCFSLNFNMPGAMELVDPNRLIPDLIPVEKMRYTPQIPISDTLMNDFKKKLEIYHLKKHQFVVKKESVFALFMFACATFVFWKIVTFILEKDEEITLEYERMKVARIRNS